jgi:hypothetical protein
MPSTQTPSSMPVPEMTRRTGNPRPLAAHARRRKLPPAMTSTRQSCGWLMRTLLVSRTLVMERNPSVAFLLSLVEVGLKRVVFAMQVPNIGTAIMEVGFRRKSITLSLAQP